jgi:hypothetical protein
MHLAEDAEAAPYGRHGFYVRAIDEFGNKDATAAAHSFKVVRR